MLAISSLDGPYGIGTLGKAAYTFVDALAAAGQRYWQVLPLTPTGPGNSPYQSICAFAGEENYIDFGLLYEDGWLTKAELEEALALFPEQQDAVFYSQLRKKRAPLLYAAFLRSREKYRIPLADFREENLAWLADFVLFSAIQKELGGKPLAQWPDDLKKRNPAACMKLAKQHREELAFSRFLQYLFHQQWSALKRYANEKGISIIGDLPFYVAPESMEVWAAPELFQKSGALAGCPPDYFCEAGQLWGNPLYDWHAMAQDGFSWWKQRIRQGLKNFDYLRIDHFRGLEAYYAIPANAKSAQEGHWETGPGMAFFQAVRSEFPNPPLIAEDLGQLSDSFFAFRDQAGFPGLKVLQFAFSPGADSAYLPHHGTRNSVIFTGTHDNDTTLGWFQKLSAAEKEFLCAYLGPQDEHTIIDTMLRTAYASLSALCIIPMQDVLGLGSEARMNVPGTAEENWRWRMKPGQFSPAIQEKLAHMVTVFGR